ncbi:hypothetical protein PMAYCL1PPCAC_31544, partial [Pristionchus mayeri]
EISVRYMRELVACTIQKRADRQVWQNYKWYEGMQRRAWIRDKEGEIVCLARRGRCPSEERMPKEEGEVERLPNGKERVRRYSEIPTEMHPVPTLLLSRNVRLEDLYYPPPRIIN